MSVVLFPQMASDCWLCANALVLAMGIARFFVSVGSHLQC